MPKLELSTTIRAPIARVFDLARSLDLHVDAAGSTRERAIAGKVTGLFGPDDEVTWRARHLGVWQALTTRMTAFEPPHHFRDSMVRGAFRRFDHDHYFVALDEHTTHMRDVFDFDAPLGPLGLLANRLFLTRYMRRFLEARNGVIQRIAESPDGWRAYLRASPSDLPRV